MPLTLRYRTMSTGHTGMPTSRRWVCAALRVAILLAAFCLSLCAQNGAPVRGLWVWKGATIVADADGIDKLRDFCQSQGINEVYISVSSHGSMLQGDFPRLIDVLHRANVRVEALLSSEAADESGKHRDKLLEQVREVVRFNDGHAKRRFDGIHLDIEPQQRPENKGAGNLRFVPGLVDAYREVRQVADAARLTVNADIQNKLLKGDLAERKLLLSSLPRLTLMLYEVSSPGDGENTQQKTEKIQAASQKFLDMAYDGIAGGDLARMVIGLRTTDYGDLLPQMLNAVDEKDSKNPRYAGWARHSYNDAAR